MSDTNDENVFKEKLLKRRDEIFGTRERLDEAWKTLQQREVVEMEETAQREHISQPIERLSEQEVGELEAIDDALGRIDAGTYGICLSCGEQISRERLDVLPWTTCCVDCAEEAERQERLPVSEE